MVLCDEDSPLWDEAPPEEVVPDEVNVIRPQVVVPEQNLNRPIVIGNAVAVMVRPAPTNEDTRMVEGKTAGNASTPNEGLSPHTPNTAPVRRGRSRDGEPHALERVSFSAGGVEGERDVIKFGIVNSGDSVMSHVTPFTVEPKVLASEEMQQPVFTPRPHHSANAETAAVLRSVGEKRSEGPPMNVEAMAEKLRALEETLSRLGHGPEKRHAELIQNARGSNQEIDTPPVSNADGTHLGTRRSEFSLDHISWSASQVPRLNLSGEDTPAKKSVSWVSQVVKDPSLGPVFTKESVNPRACAVLTQRPNVKLIPVVVDESGKRRKHPPAYEWTKYGSGFEYVMGVQMQGSLTRKGLEALCSIIEEVVGVRKQYDWSEDGQRYSTVQKGSLVKAVHDFIEVNSVEDRVNAGSETSSVARTHASDFGKRVWEQYKAHASHMKPWTEYKFPGRKAPSEFQVHASLRECHELKPLAWSVEWGRNDLTTDEGYKWRLALLAIMQWPNGVTLAALNELGPDRVEKRLVRAAKYTLLCQWETWWEEFSDEVLNK